MCGNKYDILESWNKLKHALSVKKLNNFSSSIKIDDSDWAGDLNASVVTLQDQAKYLKTLDIGLNTCPNGMVELVATSQKNNYGLWNLNVFSVKSRLKAATIYTELTTKAITQLATSLLHIKTATQSTVVILLQKTQEKVSVVLVTVTHWKQKENYIVNNNFERRVELFVA